MAGVFWFLQGIVSNNVRSTAYWVYLGVVSGVPP